MIDPEQEARAFADACIRCGICATCDCGNFANGEPNLGDLVESILNGEDTWNYAPFTCALCNRCTVNCPVGLHANLANRPLRALLLAKNPELAASYRQFRTDFKYNLFSMLAARNRGDISDVRYIEGAPDLGGLADHTAFFPGCSLYAYAPKLTQTVSTWLREQSIAAYTITICCGATFFEVGFVEEFEAYRKHVQAFLASHQINRLVVTCPHCFYLLPLLLEGSGVELVRLTDILAEHGMTDGSVETLTFHDSCYDRETSAFGDGARALFPEAVIKPMRDERRDCLCCGSGGMVSAYAPDYCTYRRNLRLAEIDEVEADSVLSTCFSCVNSLQRGIGSTPVRHYLEPIFDCPVDWNEVYASMDSLFADPAFAELGQGDELTLAD